MARHKKNLFMNLIYHKNTLYTLIAIGAIVGISGTVYGLYTWYSIQRDKKAQNTFMNVLEVFEKSRREAHADMTNSINDFKKGLEQHKNSSLAPYFMAFESLCFQEQGNLSQALQEMEKALTQFSSKDPLFPLYVTKLALLKVDSEQEEVRKEGIDSLKKLAEDSKNIHRDMALYWLGCYAESQNKQEEATYWWNLLMTQESHSPLARYIYEKNK